MSDRVCCYRLDWPGEHNKAKRVLTTATNLGRQVFFGGTKINCFDPALAAIGTSRTMSTRSKRFLFVVVLLLVIVTFLIGFYGLWLIWDDEYPV